MRAHKALFVSFVALAVPVGAASMAYGCTALATLNVSSGSAAPGQTISGTGKGFNGGGHGTPAGTTPVVLRWNSRTGPEMQTAALLNPAGDISFSFAAPNVPPGSYVLIGVQNNPLNGTPFYGTPARQSIQIVAAGSRTAAAKGDSAAVPATATEPTAAAATGQPAATSAAPAAAQTPAAAAASRAVAAPAAPVAAGQAAPAAAAAAAGTATAVAAAGQPATEAGQPLAAADAGAPVAASPADTATITTTPGLIGASSPDGGSIAPAVLLMLLGIGIGLAASARLLTSRLPQLRNRSGIASA